MQMLISLVQEKILLTDAGDSDTMKVGHHLQH